MYVAKKNEANAAGEQLVVDSTFTEVYQAIRAYLFADF